MCMRISNEIVLYVQQCTQTHLHKPLLQVSSIQIFVKKKKKKK